MAAHRVTERRQDAGFTLIEVMIAVLLTAIAVIGALALFRINTAAAGLSRHQTEAAILAQDKLEALRTVTVPASATEGPLNSLGQTTPCPCLYTRTSTVGAISSEVYPITVAVTWDEDGTSKTITVRGRR